MERILVSCRKLLLRELDLSIRAHRKWKGPPQDCFDVSCLFVQICVSLSAIASSDRLGLPKEALLDPCRRLIQEGLHGFISDVLSEGPSSTDEGEVIETPRVSKPRIKHVFGNELRHHCLRCGHDQNVISFIFDSLVPFLSVWSCRFK